MLDVMTRRTLFAFAFASGTAGLGRRGQDGCLQDADLRMLRQMGGADAYRRGSTSTSRRCRTPRLTGGKRGCRMNWQSCHTAMVDGYAVEGHVPAADIQRLIKSGDKAKGLAVPGMPMGSPGMEGPRSDAYSVMLFDADGKARCIRAIRQSRLEKSCEPRAVAERIYLAMAHIFRRLLRSPLFTGVTLLTLAIGIGANTAIFSVIEGVLIKPLPYPNPDQLIAVWHTAPGLSIPQLPNVALQLVHLP